MAFHELATNAVKYGALSNIGGSVLIGWVSKLVSHGRELNISWREKGGPTVSTPLRTGFGTKLLERGLAHELDGSFDLQYHADGVSCEIVMPVADDRNA